MSSASSTAGKSVRGVKGPKKGLKGTGTDHKKYLLAGEGPIRPGFVRKPQPRVGLYFSAGTLTQLYMPKLSAYLQANARKGAITRAFKRTRPYIAMRFLHKRAKAFKRILKRKYTVLFRPSPTTLRRRWAVLNRWIAKLPKGVRKEVLTCARLAGAGGETVYKAVKATCAGVLAIAFKAAITSGVLGLVRTNPATSDNQAD